MPIPKSGFANSICMHAGSLVDQSGKLPLSGITRNKFSKDRSDVEKLFPAGAT